MLKKFRITVDGKPYTVTVEDMADEGSHLYPAGGDVAVPVAPVATPVAAPAPAAAPKAAAAAGAGDIPCPLGGVVKDVKVAVGATVNEGDIVVVIEAMKMLTNVFSNITGKVTAVHVKPGDGVDSGQALISIG